MGGKVVAPTPYKPPNQEGAAAAFQQGTGQLMNQGSDLYNQVAPQYAGVTSAVANNPYFQQAMEGAQGAASQATNVVAPQQFAGAAQNAGVAGMAAAAAPQYANAATAAGQQGYSQAQSMLPGAMQGMQIAPEILQYLAGTGVGVFNQGMDNANTSWNQSQGALNNVNAWNGTMMDAAGRTLNTAYDPQRDLYNRSYQQMLEQTNAINAQNGVSGSPFAAGIGAQNSGNFNIDWDNAQLGRQVQALGAYGTASGTATNNVNNTLATGAQDYNTLSSGAVGNLTGLVNSGVNNYNSLNTNSVNNANNLINTGTGALNNGINTGVNALSSLGQTTIAGNQAASDLNRAGLNTMTTAAVAPSQVYLGQQQAQLDALNAQVSGQNSAGAMTQQGVADSGQYLNIGQTAAANTTQAANANAQNANALVKNVLSAIPW